MPTTHSYGSGGYPTVSSSGFFSSPTARLKSPPPVDSASRQKESSPPASPPTPTTRHSVSSSPLDPGAPKAPSWGKPSKKNSLEDDVPDEHQIESMRMNQAAPTHLRQKAASETDIIDRAKDRQSSPPRNTSWTSAAASPTTATTTATTTTAATSSSSILRRPSSATALPDRPRRRESAVRFEMPAETSRQQQQQQQQMSPGLSEEDQLKAAIEASERTSSVVMSPEDIEGAKMYARSLRESAKRDGVDIETIEQLLALCKGEKSKIERCIEVFSTQGGDEGVFYALFDLSGIIANAIEIGEETLRAAPPKPPPLPKPNDTSLDVASLVRNHDVFTLICTLRAQQRNRALDAAMALMHFVREAEGGNEEQLKLREEIRSSGGMHSLLTLFRTRGHIYELKVVAAMAIAYLLPSFIESSSHTDNSLSLKIVECIRFLSSARAVSPNGEHITSKDSFEAATVALTSFWINHLGPKLSSTSLAIEGSERLKTRTGTPFLRGATQRGRSDVIFNKSREIIALRELMESTVSLIVYVARHGSEEKTMALVEQVCAIEIARPIAVRERVLEVLVEWLETTDGRAATLAMRDLTLIKENYMAGWIHSEMVNKGAVKALARLAHKPTVKHEVRLAIAQILSSLCAAPHTRAAVVEAKCLSFFIGFLHDISETSSEEVVLFSGSALMQLAAGAITRSIVLSGEEREIREAVSPDKSDTLVK